MTGGTSEAFARALAEAEQRLRAQGLTGATAFEAVRDTLLARAGRPAPAHPALADLRLPDADLDLLGLAYERFFPDLFKGRLGQFFTPRPIVELLLSRVPLGPELDVLDPTCGSGGLLVEAARRGASVRGLDIDPRMADLARVNLALGGLTGTVTRGDFFAAHPEPADVLIANPPFSVEVTDPDVLSRYDLGRSRSSVASDALFMEAIEGWVRPGGWAALVLPWTFVANRSAGPLRERVDRAWCRRAVCALPEGVFRPFGGAAGRAALVWLQRRPSKNGATQWASLSDPGYDVRSTRLTQTTSAEVSALSAGRGWQAITSWLPETRSDGEPLSSWVTVDTRSVPGRAAQSTVDLADTDRTTGEVRPRRRDNRGRKARLEEGMVLVARMRPELGNVVVVPPSEGLAGSPEWIRLCCSHPHVLLHLVRSPGWREQLPPTTGQTRPRTDVESVLATVVPRPPAELSTRIEQLSAGILAERRALLDKLRLLQSAMDDYVSTGDATALDTSVRALEDP